MGDLPLSMVSEVFLDFIIPDEDSLPSWSLSKFKIYKKNTVVLVLNRIFKFDVSNCVFRLKINFL